MSYYDENINSASNGFTEDTGSTANDPVASGAEESAANSDVSASSPVYGDTSQQTSQEQSFNGAQQTGVTQSSSGSQYTGYTPPTGYAPPTGYNPPTGSGYISGSYHSQESGTHQYSNANGAWSHTPSPSYGRSGGEEPQKPRRRKKIGRRILAAVLTIAVLGGACGVFFSQYTFVSGDSGTLFSIVSRDSLSAPVIDNSEPEANDVTGNGSAGLSDTAANPDGPTLEIHDAPTSSELASGGVTTTSGVLTIPEIAEKCTPSVVGITASTDSQYYGTVSSVGTGIIMSTDGYIITNCHVIDGATYIVVTLMDETTVEATLVGSDERSDLAVLKIDPTGLELVAAEFGNSDELRVGELVVAIGNPLGLDFMGTVTDGIVSAINRNVVVDERTMTLIQTNAAINSGNSGGPLINQYGQVIGINTLKMQDYSTTVEGLGFAIPTNTAKEIVDELIAYGYVKGRPALGIEGQNVDSYVRQLYGVPYGVIVMRINSYSSAYAAGLRPGDIITEFNGQLVYSVDEINSAKEDFTAGEQISLTFYRVDDSNNGTYHEITFTLDDEAVLDKMDAGMN